MLGTTNVSRYICLKVFPTFKTVGRTWLTLRSQNLNTPGAQRCWFWNNKENKRTEKTCVSLVTYFVAFKFKWGFEVFLSSSNSFCAHKTAFLPEWEMMEGKNQDKELQENSEWFPFIKKCENLFFEFSITKSLAASKHPFPTLPYCVGVDSIQHSRTFSS